MKHKTYITEQRGKLIQSGNEIWQINVVIQIC